MNFGRGILGANGKMYFEPYFISEMHESDPSENALSQMSSPQGNFFAMNADFNSTISGTVLARNGNIYCIPSFHMYMNSPAVPAICMPGTQPTPTKALICRSCPVNSMPDASSINIGNCTCLDGHERNYMATSEDKFDYMTCPENTYRLSEDTYCLPCNVGSHYKATGVTSADDCLIDCKIRQYQNSSTTKQCTYCPPGHYMHNDTTFGTGSSFCKRCEVGKHNCPRHTGRRVWECGETKRRICHKTTQRIFLFTRVTQIQARWVITNCTMTKYNK